MAVPCIFFLLSVINLALAAEPRFSQCGTVNYTADSPFATNIDRALAFLNTSTSQTGFNATTTGDGTDQISALALCRGDLGYSHCQSCISDAVDRILYYCPNKTDAQVWFDNCLLRYSTANFLTESNANAVFYIWIDRNVTDQVAFNRQLGSLMNQLSSKAAAATSRYAAEENSLSDFSSVYGLVECTRDLSGEDCKRCLVELVSKIESCWAGKSFGFIGAPSCTLRFSVDPLYNFTAVVTEAAEIAPPPSLLPGSPEILLDSGGGRRQRLAIGISVGVVLGVFFVGFCLCVLVKREKAKGWKRWERESVAEEVEERDEESSFLFERKTIESATNGFSDSNLLGRGGFGPVYKGKLSNGKEIAVKKLDVGSTQGEREFTNEVKLLLKLSHRNLIILLGCCIDGGDKMLVYEYLPKKSLDNFLFDKSKSALLDWPKRFNIIMGIAKGLLYLHQESQLRIIHRDIKASNILLDEHMQPKISDFGFARLFHGEESHANTRIIAGTLGYMAPEYARRGVLSAKCDVYSFGVVLLEILSGRKNFDKHLDEEKQQLIRHAWTLRRQGKLTELLDLTIGSCPRDLVLKCTEIGLLCCESNPESKPPMELVVLMLSNNSTTIPQPRNPGYGNSTNTIRPSSASYSDHVSRNYISISDFDGR